jgi:hypothetical protein
MFRVLANRLGYVIDDGKQVACCTYVAAEEMAMLVCIENTVENIDDSSSSR